jgi:hypothetical protein
VAVGGRHRAIVIIPKEQTSSMSFMDDFPAAGILDIQTTVAQQ